MITVIFTRAYCSPEKRKGGTLRYRPERTIVYGVFYAGRRGRAFIAFSAVNCLGAFPADKKCRLDTWKYRSAIF